MTVDQTILVVLAYLFIIAWLAISAARWRILIKIPSLRNYSSDGGYENLSVIIAVRNEEKNIARCLESLLRVGYPCEIVVVDDNSTDATWIVLQNFKERGVKAVKASDPGYGWVGKTWACHIGYLNSSGEWLLFTDADTEFIDQVIQRVFTAVRQHGLEMVTVYPMFRFNSLLHKLCLHILLVGLNLLSRPDKVAEGKSGVAFGSFILIRRDVYEKVGGHASVSKAVLEDRALALRTLRKGVRSMVFDGADFIIASWNEDSISFWNGMKRVFIPLSLTKNMKQFLAYLFALIVCVALIPLLALKGYFLEAALTFLTPVPLLGMESRRNSNSLLYGFLWYFGMIVVVAAIVTSFIQSRIKPEIRWRGRVYRVRMGEFHEEVITSS